MGKKYKKVFCADCGKGYLKYTGYVNENLRLGHNFFCSRECMSQHRTKKKLLHCENCGREFWRQPNDISPHNYCSQSCAAIVNNRKYPKRKRLEYGNICLPVGHRICQRCGREFEGNYGRKYCSVECRRAVRQPHTPQELIEIIQRTAHTLKRIPARRELRRVAENCRSVFGSWNKAVIMAGLVPNRSHSQRMYKRTKTRARDGHFCDSVSEAIIDDWLSKHHLAHERDVIYPTTSHKADWAVLLNGRTIFVEYFGLAKDSPRYDRAIKCKKELCQKHGIELVAIYPWDIYPSGCLEENLNKKFQRILQSGWGDLHPRSPVPETGALATRPHPVIYDLLT